MPASHLRLDRRTIPLAAVTGGYTLAAAVGAVVTGNGEFVFYVAVMVVLIAVVLAVHARVGLSLGVLWGLCLWGGLHMAGGLVPVPESWPIHGDVRVLYSWWLIPGHLKYDQLVHVFGFAVTCFVLWQCLRSAAPDVRPTLGPLVLCAAGSMGFGALNEVVEFAATLLMPQTNVGGYINTGWDLVANAVGAITAAVIIRLTASPAPQP